MFSLEYKSTDISNITVIVIINIIKDRLRRISEFYKYRQ